MTDTQKNLIYLCHYAVSGKEPDKERVSGMDMEKLYALAKKHTLPAVTGFALKSIGAETPEFFEAREKAMRKNILLDAERARLFRYLDENRIWHMPLKGVILKSLYPKNGMRQMSDNDILYDASYKKQIREYFLSSGYKTDNEEIPHHEEYTKPPVLNFEMHNSLFSLRTGDVFYEYYKNVKEHLVKDSGSEYAYHFTDEDYYIYFTAHEYKHFSDGGTGLRSLLDRYVFLCAKDSSLDHEYICRELEKLGIADYEKQSRELCMKLFSSAELPELTEDELELIDFYFGSGTYGTFHNRTLGMMKKHAEKTGNTSKFRYMLSRIFPDMDFYRRCYPLAYKYKILIPFCWIYKTVKTLLFRRDRISAEFDTLKKTGNIKDKRN